MSSEPAATDASKPTKRRCRICGHVLAEQNQDTACYRHSLWNVINPPWRPLFISGPLGRRIVKMDRRYHGR